MEEQNPRLTNGESPGFQQNKKRSFSLAADQLDEAFLSLQTLFMQGMSRNHFAQ